MKPAVIDIRLVALSDAEVALLLFLVDAALDSDWLDDEATALAMELRTHLRIASPCRSRARWHAKGGDAV